MFDAPPDVQLQLARLEQGLAISVWVGSPPPHPLRWRLELTSRSPGGSSTVSQGGTVSTTSAGPVGSVTVAPNSRGSAILRIYDGDREVAREEVSFEENAGHP